MTMTYPPHVPEPSPPIHGPLLARQDGVALVTVVFLTAVILTLIVMGSRETQIELRIAHNALQAEQALNAAEAGLNHAYGLIKDTNVNGFNDELSNGGTGGVLASLGSYTTLAGVSYRFAALGGGANDGYYVKVIDNYDETTGADDPTDDKDNVITIISRGRVGSAERIVAATLKGDTLFPSLIFGKLFVSLGGSNTFTDSFDSRVAPYSAATAGSNGSLFSNGDISANSGKITVKGNATASGTVSGGTVTGTITNGAPPLTFPSIAPCGPPYSTGAGLAGPPKDFKYDAATGALQVTGTINLAPGTYCFGSIAEASKGQITANGPVIIFITGDLSLGGGGIVNATQIPSNLLVLSSYVSTGDGITLGGGSDLYAGIYAPDCGIKLTGGADIFGSLIGRTFSMQGGAGMHYDEALGKVTFGFTSLYNWHEERSS